MSDVDLTLLPQSTVSFRLGYSHNNMTGPSYSSIHEGTEASLLQDWNTTMNSYRLGVDFRIAPRTVLSYDQFLDYYKGDTDYQLNPINEALLPTTPVSSVSLGLSIDTANKEPCAVVPPGNQSDCQRDADQCHMQRVLQLFAEPADPHLHAHRARQPAQQLLPAVRAGRFFFLQLRHFKHAVGRIFRRPDHAHQHPRLHRHRDCRCQPHFRRGRSRGHIASDPASAPDREILFLGLSHSTEWQFHRTRQRLYGCNQTAKPARC